LAAQKENVAKAADKTVPKASAKEDDTKSSSRTDPYGRDAGKGTHMGDMAMFQGINKGQDITVFNKSGSNLNVQSAMLGVGAGSFMG
jgi:hypothetical protein